MIIKKLKHLFITTLFLSPFATSIAQELKGTVYHYENQRRTPLPGVNVYWAGTTTGTISDAEGHFNLRKPENLPAKLVFSFVGFRNDTLTISTQRTIQVTLEENVMLDEVEITGKRRATYMDMFEPANTQVITTRELQKAACCNLAESFETNPAVDVTFSDAVTGAKHITMLGLDGKYSMIMRENIPAVRGLNASYGLTHIPGPWIESIEISKGSGSVVNGYESITGQINAELFKPETSPRVFLNLFGSDAGRMEANILYAPKIKNESRTLFLAHGNMNNLKKDHHGDGFLDMPLNRQINLMNRWSIPLSGTIAMQAGASFMAEDRVGGQMHFDHSRPTEVQDAYGIGINTTNTELFTKTGWIHPEKPYKSAGLILSASRYDMKSFFGHTVYDALQNSFQGKLIYQSIFGSTAHAFRTGLSWQTDIYNENLNDSLFGREENVPGAFFEYTYSLLDKLSIVPGLRADYHNMQGIILTPRLHARYSINSCNTIRVSGGKGFRTPNVLAENTSIFASSRELMILDEIMPEIAWNFGISYTKSLRIFNRETYFTADAYRTEFVNKTVVDLDSDPDQILIGNLHGLSYSNSIQATVDYEWSPQLNIRLAYKIEDTKTTIGNELRRNPMVPVDRVLLNIGYESRHDKWKADLTTQRVGRQRVPHTHLNHFAAEYSQAFYLVNSQITRNFKKLSLYVGGENLLGFKQKHPVLGFEDPWASNGKSFDASLIWGPVEGRKFYGGLRYTID